ncbi:MAG TPA: primosomal protein N' [Candidatus Latescibacteria bacterium]|jgi:primosomal protein N' (replication factor Y)|nr:primosomal protein N' [Gemmatimonadaceae bacterium]MDP6017722.1 primosomal protein N' [Candidatus Latescibacterota bacterium]HJP31168.1 primosomal protein N' [Candidatus Latescibacterota bacterium]
MSRRLVEVALPPPLSRQLTYGVPEELVDVVVIGSVVLVPVQQRLVTGFVVSDSVATGDGDGRHGASRIAPNRIRDLTQVIDTESPISPEVVRLCAWMSDYYLAPMGSALAAALPPGVRLTSSRTVQLVGRGGALPDDTMGARVCIELTGSETPLKVTTLRKRLGKQGLEAALRRLQRQGMIDMRPDLSGGSVSAKHQQMVAVIDTSKARGALSELLPRARGQARCLQRLLETGTMPKRRLVEEGFSYAMLKSLQTRGLIETTEEEVVRDPLADIDAGEAPELDPTADQRQVLEQIGSALDTGEFSPILLRGVTGSGKTLVYMQATERVLQAGGSAIILTPEIALAWQMVRRFRARFGAEVAVLHSQLSLGERYDTWRRLRRGEQRLVIGARSAIFAPVQDLGLIIVDEEHDGSYFQDDLESRQPLAYSGRDLAVVRARFAGIPVVLGSATPCLESWLNVRSGKYTLAELPHRVDDRPLARVEVVDMRREPFQKRERTLFSKSLRLKIRERLEKQQQIVLLQNRRGFAPVVQCTACGESVECLRCLVTLTCHRSQGEQLRCHYCDYRVPLPEKCPKCGSEDVRLAGAGTQKVETALEEQFPGIRVLRMDVDTTGWKGAHDELVERFRRHEADVLLGTQMVAKGLDFPEVTLVGVISADTGFHMPDFRAAERSFQLLTQVAGRSGRGETPGEVVIQTRQPEEPVLQAAARQDFDAFCEAELQERRAAGFPPFGRLVVIRWRGAAEATVTRVAAAGSQHLSRACRAGVSVLGPAPAPLARLRGNYRWQSLLVGISARDLRATAALVLDDLRTAASRHDVDVAVVVDPQSTM